jgi:hypothetical protein
MSWVFGPGGGGTPGGADQDIQFNNNGSFSGSSLLTTDGSGSLSASTHVSASTFYGDGSNLTGVTASAVQVADGPEFSLQFRRDTPVTGEISGSENFVVSSDMSKLFLTGTLIASSSTGNPAQFEGQVLVTSPEGELVVRDTSANKQVRVTADALPTIEFGDITDTDDYFYIQGGATSKIIVDTALNAFIISDTTAGTEGITYKPTQGRVGINTPSPTHAFTVNGDTSVTGAISASIGISSSQVEAGNAYVTDAYVSSIPADRVLVSTTDGQITSHSPFTFSSDVLFVPTITASVGIETVDIQAETLDVTSSANGSISIGEGIIYTFGGLDRIDAFEDTFKLRDVNYYKAVSTVQTSNFNIEGFQTFLVDTTGSVITGTLPGLTSDSQIGLTYTIKDYAGSGSTNNVVIEPSGSQEIDGGTAAEIQTNYGAITLTAFSSSHGYSWGIVSAT